MDQAAILGVVRHGLTTLGGGVAASFGLTGSMWEAAVGAVMVLVGVAWSVLEKRAR
jgi:hypothetical protein